MRGDEEKQPSGSEGHARDDRPAFGEPELRDLRSGQPEPGEQNEEEAHLGEARSGVLAHGTDPRTRVALGQVPTDGGTLRGLAASACVVIGVPAEHFFEQCRGALGLEAPVAAMGVGAVQVVFRVV
jgi:hypothetical protein